MPSTHSPVSTFLSEVSALSQPGFFVFFCLFFWFLFVFTLPLPQAYFQVGYYASIFWTQILRYPGMCPQSYSLISFPDAQSGDQSEEQGTA